MIISIDAHPVDRLALRLSGLRVQLRRPAGIMRTIAAGIEHQTQRRIEHEKTAPDGTKWAPWSARYAKTRNTGVHSLLMDTWALARGLQHKSTADTATAYTTRKHAGTHQTGYFGLLSRGSSMRIPKREFFGLSDSNARDLERWLAPALEGLAAEALKGGRAK